MIRSRNQTGQWVKPTKARIDPTMIATVCPKHMYLYGYGAEASMPIAEPDVKALYKLATQSRPTKKLILFGGTHGLDPTGVPSGQDPDEKVPLYPEDTVVKVGGTRVTSFALDQASMKRSLSSINFVYTNLSKFTTPGHDMTAEKQEEVVKLIKQYHASGTYYILMCWCFSHVWAQANGL
jgi:hypothetical protein